ncbi:hypothetical protein ACFV6G_37705 [Streptomyces lavendulae]|uniref:hypothetical protein n=1 Tax=Streptomyces lavendulae TaxID=1914 RepID=UPI003684473A
MRSNSPFLPGLANLLFVSEATTADYTDPARTRKLIHETAHRLGANGPAQAQAAVAYEFGRWPESAQARMRNCLAAVEAATVEVPVPGPRTAVTR